MIISHLFEEHEPQATRAMDAFLKIAEGMPADKGVYASAVLLGGLLGLISPDMRAELCQTVEQILNSIAKEAKHDA